MPQRSPDLVTTWERLLRFQRATVEEMDRSLRDRFDHSLDEYDVLHQVAVHEAPIRMGDLAARLLVANSSCTRLVGRLVEAGLLRRRPGDDDGRAILVEITPRGRRLHRRMAAVHTRDIERLVTTTFSAEAARALDGALPPLP